MDSTKRAGVASLAGKVLRGAVKSPLARNLAGRAALGTGVYAAEPYLAGAVAGGKQNLPDRQRSSRLISAILASAIGPNAISKGIHAPGVGKIIGPAAATMTAMSPSLVSGVSHRMFGPEGLNRGKSMTRNMAAAAGHAYEEPLDAFKAMGSEFGKEMGRASAKHYGTAGATGLTGYLLARMLLPRSEQPENRSMEEADEFYEAERKRRALAGAIGVGSAGLGLGASFLAPKVGPALNKGMSALRNRFGA